MLTADQEKYILHHAYIPEHTVRLMTTLSGGEGFLVDDFFLCRRDDWLIVVGYPLQGEFTLDKFEALLENIRADFNPARISLIAPQLSNRLDPSCRQRDSDQYYTRHIGPPTIGDAVKRNLKKAAGKLTVEHAPMMGDAHRELIKEFLNRAKPPQRIENLFSSMPEYVAAAPSARVINAWFAKGVLSAFYVIDLAAADFANYIIGCYSRKNYVRGASDLLVDELIKMSAENGKAYIHMGLGVNDGVRRFKEKWGARPTRPYEMCELVFKKPLLTQFLRSILKS